MTDVGSPVHERLAAATRHLVEAVLRSRATDAQLDVAATEIEVIAHRLEQHRLPHAAPSSARTHTGYVPRSAIVGMISPVAPPFSYERTVDGVVARGAFGTPAEGPPGYVHGGWLALAFDEALGMANSATGHPGVTGRLTVRYRQPTPLHTEVTLEARTVRVDGRRITTIGTLRAGDQTTAEAEALFVALGADQALEYFGKRGSNPQSTCPAS